MLLLLCEGIGKYNSVSGFLMPRHVSNLDEEAAGGGACQATLHHLSVVLANRGGPRCLEACQWRTLTYETSEGGSGEPQACQPDLCAGEDYGTIHPECAHQACEGQPGDQAQPAWVHERQVLLDQPHLLL